MEPSWDSGPVTGVFCIEKSSDRIGVTSAFGVECTVLGFRSAVDILIGSGLFSAEGVIACNKDDRPGGLLVMVAGGLLHAAITALHNNVK